MDDLIKILQKLMSESPKPKGGIANTAEGIEFIGRKLTKDEIGGNAIIGSKLTDASRFKPFSIGNVGIENRYSLLREYGDDLAKKFEETITFIKNNPDVRFSQVQKDNILYNLGVYRRVVAEKDKIARGLTEQGKNVDDIFNKRVDTLPNEMLTLEQSLEKFNKTIADMAKKVKETEDIFKPEKVTDERKIRLKRLYDGPGYNRPNSSLYRGYGSFFLSKLHDKGIIKLDDKIYKNLVKGAHHYGGADYFAPDPVRIWRKHFGNEVFEKLDNFNPDGEDIFQWLERNNIQPIQKDGPKNALEYLTPTEISQQLADETSAFGKYKNPESAGDDAQFFYKDKPSQRMERITYHGENIGALEQALQALDPDSYREYFRTKPRYDSKVLPFKELNAEGGRVGFGEGSEGIVEIDFASAEDKAFSDMMEAYRYYLISGGKKSLRDYMRMSTGAGKKGGGREHFRGAEGGRVGYKVGGHSRFEVGSGYYGETPTKKSPSKNDRDGNQNTVPLKKPDDLLTKIKLANPPDKSPFEKFAAHDQFTDFMKMMKVPNYHQMGGFDFMSRFPNIKPNIAKGLASAYQQITEMGKANPDPLGDYTDVMKAAQKKAAEETRLNIKGIDDFFDPTSETYKQYTNPATLLPTVQLANGGRVGFQGGGKDASQPDFDPGPGKISSDDAFANTERSMVTQEIQDRPVFNIETVGDPALNPASRNVEGGIDYRPSFIEPTFFETVVDKGKQIYNNPLVRFGLGLYLPTEFKRIQQLLALKNVADRFGDIKNTSIDEALKSLTFNAEPTSFSSGPGAGIRGLLGNPTPEQEYYNDKIIRDNMDAIREDMSLYFDPPEEKSFFDGITDEDLYKTYDERKGYDSIFEKQFTTEDGKNIGIPYKPDEGIDIGGLLELLDKSDQGVRPFDIREDQFKEYEV